jgi:hypothetical protein
MNHFLPSSSGEAFINVEDLRKGKIDEFDWTGRQVWLGLDLAMTNDNTSFSMVTEEDGKIFVDSFAFVPEDRIPEKNRVEKITYQEFIEAGKCYSCGDMTIDYGFVEEVVLNIEARFGVSIVGVAYDRWNCLSTAQRLDRAGYKVVEVKQHSSVLHPATKLLKEKILSKEFFYTENKLLEIVKLVGEDVLPDDQRLILEVSKLLKVGFLQQNAFHKDDTFVPIQKQYLMLKVINLLYERGMSAVKLGVPISRVKDDEVYNEVMKMKYNISNDNLGMFDGLFERIGEFYNKLEAQYA